MIDTVETTGHDGPMPKFSHEDTLLDVGMRLLHSRGFNASSVQDIVSAAGVPKGSFYNHFSSKDALGLAALERYWELSADARAVLEDKSMTSLDRLDRHFEALGFTENGCMLGNFTAELSMQEAFRPAMLAMWRAWTSTLARCLSDGQRHGEVRTDTPVAELAQAVLALWEGAVLISRIERSPKPMTAARRNIRRLVCS